MILDEREQLVRRRRLFRLKFYGTGGLLGLIFILLLALIIRSPYFQVREINITGIEDAKKTAILSYLISKKQSLPILKYLGYGNLLLWNNGKINFEIPQIDSGRVEIDLETGTINITVKEKERFFIWCGEGKDCFWIGRDGTTLEEAPSGDGPLVAMIVGSREIPIIIGDKILNNKTFANLIKTLDILKNARLTDLALRVNSKGELTAHLKHGPAISFNLSIDPAFSIPVLAKLRAEANFYNLQYLDFRIENKAYYQ